MERMFSIAFFVSWTKNLRSYLYALGIEENKYLKCKISDVGNREYKKSGMNTLGWTVCGHVDLYNDGYERAGSKAQRQSGKLFWQDLPVPRNGGHDG